MPEARLTLDLTRGRELYALGAGLSVALAIYSAANGLSLLAVVSGFLALASLEAALHRPATASVRATWVILLGTYALTLGALFGIPRLLMLAAS